MESGSPTIFPPLHADPQRQAVPSIGGYLYQIWRSVHAWLELSGDDCIYLEGAEDFDVVAASHVTVTQVKDTSEKITLRSENVLEAIRNFWLTRTRNPDRKISFRYLTRSTITGEKEEPFGPGIRGLELWQQARNDPDAAEVVRTFLLSENRLGGALAAFLRQADLPTIMVELFGAMTWETEGEELGRRGRCHSRQAHCSRQRPPHPSRPVGRGGQPAAQRGL